MAKMKKRSRETSSNEGMVSTDEGNVRLQNHKHRRIISNENDKHRQYLSLRDVCTTSLDSTRIQNFIIDYPNLKYLDISRFPLDTAIIQIIHEKWINQLVSINLEYSVCMNDRLLTLLLLGSVANPKKNAELSKLREINLSFTSITDYGVRLLVSVCPNLQSITLKSCAITDLSMSIIAQRCRSLKELIVADCNLITDFGVQIIAQQLKDNLQVIDLNDCQKITNGIFQYLCFFCPELKCLRIRNTKITTEGLQGVVRFKLEELNLHGLPVTDSLIFQLVQHQQQLEIMDLSFCHLVTATAIKEILNSCQRLRELHLFGSNQMSEFWAYDGMVKLIY